MIINMLINMIDMKRVIKQINIKTNLKKGQDLVDMMIQNQNTANILQNQKKKYSYSKSSKKFNDSWNIIYNYTNTHITRNQISPKVFIYFKCNFVVHIHR